MRKSVRSHIQKPKRSLPHFHPFVSVITLVLGILGTLFVTHVIAQATNNVIYACAQKQTGNLRMVDANTSCHPDETAVQWNVQGPTGPQGPQGPQGSSGSGYFGLPFICGHSTNLSSIANLFANKDFTGAVMDNCQFYKVNVQGVILKNAFAGSFLSSGSDFSHADFSNAYMAASNLLDSNFSNVNFTGATFTDQDNNQSYFTNTNLTGANFTNANLHYATDMNTANLTNVIWNNTTCPDGTNSSTNGTSPQSCIGHL